MVLNCNKRDDLVPWSTEEFVQNFQKLTQDKFYYQNIGNLKPKKQQYYQEKVKSEIRRRMN